MVAREPEHVLPHRHSVAASASKKTRAAMSRAGLCFLVAIIRRPDMGTHRQRSCRTPHKHVSLLQFCSLLSRFVRQAHHDFLAGECEQTGDERMND